MPPIENTASRKTILFGLGGLVLGLVIGYLMGQSMGAVKIINNATQSGNQSTNLILNQSATAQGKVISVVDSKITIEGDDGKRTDFNVSKPVNIYIFKDKVSPSMVSNDLTSVEVSKTVLLNLGMVSGQYLVTTITVLPPSTVPSSTSVPPNK